MKISDTHRLLRDDNSALPFVTSPHGGGPLSGGRPRFLILHYTAGGTLSGAVNWFTQPASKASAHLVIGQDGAITQMMPFDRIAWHAGVAAWQGQSGLNRHSVGIELVNWGRLIGGPGQWKSHTGKAIPDHRVIKAAHKQAPGKTGGWETYDVAQIDAAVKAARAIVRRYGIPESHVLGHDDIAPGRKSDPGPAFNMVDFKRRLYG